jgi:hypothetical protein
LTVKGLTALGAIATATSMVALLPPASSPLGSVQETVGALKVQFQPAGALVETKLVPAGRLEVKVIGCVLARPTVVLVTL